MVDHKDANPSLSAASEGYKPITPKTNEISLNAALRMLML